ncbi:MAG: hypothetical protein OEM24_00680 [Paracoccaceae bacterium]|nr:hypothetical protein [Paracoccaceae bacterium]
MTLRLEGPLGVQSGAAAALVRQEIVPHSTRLGLAVTARLIPVALLVHADGATRAFAPDGAPLPLEEIERLRPGTLAEIATWA